MTDTARRTRRDAKGNPYWTFVVHPSHLLHNRRAAFPPEVADVLGCRPDALTRVSVEHPADCRKLLVSWERQEPTRTIIRGLAEPLGKLKAAREQPVDLIVTGRNRVEFRLTASVASGGGGGAYTYANREELKLTANVAKARGRRQPRTRKASRESEFTASAAKAPRNKSAVPQETPLAPWGAPSTPLLPRWYLLSHGNQALPRKFTRAYPRVQRVRDLARFWDHYDEPLGTNLAWTLRDMAARLPLPKGLRVLPPSPDVTELDRLPLTIRTRNCVHRGLTGGSLAGGTVGELMRLPNFGIASLLDLMCVLEAAEQHSAGLDPSPAGAATIETEEEATPADEESRSRLIPDEALTSDAVDLIAAAAREFRGATTFGDLLRLDLSDLVAAAGASADLDDPPLETGVLTVADQAVRLLDGCLAEMSEAQQLVVLRRIVPAVPDTLEALGQSAGLSRERMRQLEKQARTALEAAAGPALGLLGLIAGQRLGDVTTVPDIDDIVVELLPQPDARAGLDSLMVARRMLRSRLGYECRDGLCLSRAAAGAAREVKDSVHQLADDEGLIDGGELDVVLGEEWHDRQEDLIRWIGWPRLSERIALRATARARVKAALLKLGAPATKSELAEESGLSERQVSGALSNLKSVARADKYRWGLQEWIDDVYEGIPAEIVQRINEDGGSTRLNRLVEELPRLFKVSETSVWAYLNTPAFRVEHGWVTETTASEFETGRLVDVVDGFTHDGDPYWTFEVAQRHLEGYSLQGVPPEIAMALGCTFGDRTTASVRKPQGCQDISVIWRKTSMHGPEIGRLGPALQTLAARDATAVRLVIHDDRQVSFRLPDNVRRANIDTQSNRPHGVEFPGRGSFAGVQVAESLQARFGHESDPSNHLSPSRTVRTYPIPRQVTKE